MRMYGQCEFWNELKNKWLSTYRNKEVVKDFSLMKQVCAKDEWCAEAYLETDYSNLSNKDFEDEIKKFLSYKVRFL